MFLCYELDTILHYLYTAALVKYFGNDLGIMLNHLQKNDLHYVAMVLHSFHYLSTS